MKEIFRATLPVAPTTNQSYRTGNGRFYCSSEAIAFKDECSYILADAEVDLDAIAKLKAQKTGPKTLLLCVEFIWYLKSIITSDVDGRIKATMDVIFNYYGLNDNVVKRLVAEKELDKDNVRCVAIVSIME